MRFLLFTYFFLLSFFCRGQFVTAVYDDCCPLPRVINVEGGTGDGYVSNATFALSVLTLILNNGNPPIQVTITPEAESGTYINGTTNRVRLGTLPFLEDVWLYTTPVFDFTVDRDQIGLNQVGKEYGHWYLLLDDNPWDPLGVVSAESWRVGSYWEEEEGLLPGWNPDHMLNGIEGEELKTEIALMRAVNYIGPGNEYAQKEVNVGNVFDRVEIFSDGNNLSANNRSTTFWTQLGITNIIPNAGFPANSFTIRSETGGLIYFKVDAVNSHISSNYTFSSGIDQVPPAGYSTIIEDDLYMITTDNAIVMKSPDGNCWEIKVDNAGVVNTTNIICP